MLYQQTLFGTGIVPIYRKDSECTKDTPVELGVEDEPIYGKGIRIEPRVPGREDTQHFRDIYLPYLDPLEEYDFIAVLFSGGKDSVACYYKLLELGVPKSKIELWHHDIDGGHPTRRMDWKCTSNYVRAFAEAEGVPLRISYRKNGFFGELYRVGASERIYWEDPDSGETFSCQPSKKQIESERIKELALGDMEDELKKLGYRMKFPAKAADLSTRWCSAYLKIAVADAVIANLDRIGQLEEIGGKRHMFPAKGTTHQGRWCSGALKAAVADSVIANLEKSRSDKKILIVSGERRGESAGRSRYNELEKHRSSAPFRNRRIVHQWRPVIDYSERDCWEVLKRHNVSPHPAYKCGWNRCSCAMCIFSLPKHFAGIRELYPEEYELLKNDERILKFTIDNTRDLDTYVGSAESCVYHGDKEALHSLITGEYSVDDVYVKGEWKFPAGAFHGAEGGPC